MCELRYTLITFNRAAASQTGASYPGQKGDRQGSRQIGQCGSDCWNGCQCGDDQPAPQEGEQAGQTKRLGQRGSGQRLVKLLSLNTRSVILKLDELQAEAIELKADIITVTEAWTQMLFYQLMDMNSRWDRTGEEEVVGFYFLHLKGASLSIPSPAKSGKYLPVFAGMLGLRADMREDAITWSTVGSPGKTVTRSNNMINFWKMGINLSI